MAKSRFFLVLPFLGWGCVPIQYRPEEPTAQVPANHFDLQAPQQSLKPAGAFKQADQYVCMRVDSLGRKILNDNPQIGLKPRFAAILSPNPELFHLEDRVVFITEGLVGECKTDAQLAALLSYELGRMVAEREARTRPDYRLARSPITVPIGNAAHNSSPDLTPLAEAAKREAEKPRTVTAPRPDPTFLARHYLEQAGFARGDFDTVQPMLRKAEQNIQLERQIRGRWTP